MSKSGKKTANAKFRFLGYRIEWREILIFAFFLFLAAVFWLVLVLRQPFEATLQIPIKYTNIPDSVLFQNELPAKFNLGVSDKGLALFRSFVLNRKDSIEIDVSSNIQAKNTLLKDEELSQIIKDRLDKTTTLLRYSPSRISLEYSLLRSKKVPVIFDGEVTTQTNFLLNGDISIRPDSVMAYSSEEELRTLDFAYTTADKYENLNKNTTYSLAIRADSNVRFSPQTVEVEIPVAEFAQKKISVPITCLDQPADIQTIFFPSTVTVSFAVALSDYNSISANDFRIDLDYAELSQATSAVTKLRLTESPNYIQNISISPSSVEFIIEKKSK